MKILYLTDQTHTHGGIEKVLSQKANYFADLAGDEVIIATYNQRKLPSCYRFSEKITFIHLEINYRAGKSFWHFENLLKIIHHRAKLNGIIKEIRPDVVVSSSFGVDRFFIPFLERNIPKIKEYHFTKHFLSQQKSVKKFFLDKINNFIDQSYHQVVILNEDERKFYHTNNITIIPNPAELDAPQAPLTKKNIIAAGRIIYQKNFEHLIEVGFKISREFPDWQIHIYGDDYLGRKDILQNKIDQLSLRNTVIFKGTSADLKKTFLDYSIYALTSNYETFPMVLLEALSVGLPVVAYDCPTGPSRILKNNEDSYLIPYKNINIFVDKISILMADEKLRKEMGNKAVRNVQRFAIEKVMGQWKNLFNELKIKNA